MSPVNLPKRPVFLAPACTNEKRSRLRDGPARSAPAAGAAALPRDAQQNIRRERARTERGT